ncbi:MAG TPA: ATP-binding cassette domain-containing protein, partial [Acidimicrobiales bacterium]
MSPPPAVAAEELVLAYGHRLALAPSTFAIPAGTSVALIGPNGSGKSTLLRAIAGLLPPRSGVLEVPARRTRAAVALVLQTTDVDRSLPITARETVTMARYASRGPVRRLDRTDHAAVDRAMEVLAIADLAGRQLHELSGGQRQRVLV